MTELRKAAEDLVIALKGYALPTSAEKSMHVLTQALAQPEQEPVAWISVKDALPKAVRGVSYKQSLTDVVLVRHSDRPDYPITAHAVVGEGLGAGIAIPTDGASEHPEIAWYSASSNLNNPFDLKNKDYERYLPKIFGSKITHWKPIDTSPQPAQQWCFCEPTKCYGVGRCRWQAINYSPLDKPAQQQEPVAICEYCEKERPVIQAEGKPWVDWIDPNDKTQKQYLPHIGEPVLFCHSGKTYCGHHNGGSFQNQDDYFNTWECRWMYLPAAHGIGEKK